MRGHRELRVSPSTLSIAHPGNQEDWNLKTGRMGRYRSSPTQSLDRSDLGMILRGSSPTRYVRRRSTTSLKLLVSPANRVLFSSAEEAQAAGYRQANWDMFQLARLKKTRAP